MDEGWEDCPEDPQWSILDLNGLTHAAVKESAKNHGGIQLMGLDSSTPYLRIGNMHFQGTIAKAVGTDLVFAVSSSGNAAQSVRSAKDLAPTPSRFGLANAMSNTQSSSTGLTYMGCTDTHVTFRRIRLESRADAVGTFSESGDDKGESSRRETMGGPEVEDMSLG